MSLSACMITAFILCPCEINQIKKSVRIFRTLFLLTTMSAALIGVLIVLVIGVLVSVLVVLVIGILVVGVLVVKILVVHLGHLLLY